MHRGVGTATLAFFRSLGGLIGVAGSGAILAWQIRSLGDAHTPSTTMLAESGAAPAAALSPQVQAAAVMVYRHAIASTFVVGTCIVACAFLVILLLPEIPLHDHHHAPAAPAE